MCQESVVVPAMCSVEETREKIVAGRKLLLAGDESLLERLPPGNWIGGTITNFMTEEGGQCTREKIHVTELPEYITDVSIDGYDEESISQIYQDAPKNGFSVIIIPARSRMHFSFALNGTSYEGFAIHPLIGWISGVHLQDLGQALPKIFNGQQPVALDEGAIVMHVPLPKNKFADIGIINIFEPGDGDTIVFPNDGFRVRDAFINGKLENFGHYIFANGFDKRVPLVADYHGLLINTSLREGEKMESEVEFYAPVFSGLEYRGAKPIQDYVSRFVAQQPDGIGHQILFSCNCILNYLYSGLQGKKIAGITGPATFGEIAYLLLNQTMVYLRIIDLPRDR